jgi:uncharacterized protein YwqG
LGEAMPADTQIADHLDYLNSLRKPAIVLARSEGNAFSKLGGLPQMPDELNWPKWNGKPLAFICQIALGEIGCARLGLPDSGQLFVFYDQEQRTWGFDPKDRGSWRVLYTARGIEECRERFAPPGLDVVYRTKAIGYTAAQTYPDLQDERVYALDLSDKARDEYIDLCSDAPGVHPFHWMFGYPMPIQNNGMDLECQLASNGLYCGDSSAYDDPRCVLLEPGRSEWLMLLQIDSDDDAEMMWGDVGMLYFWIKRRDLEQRRFDDCWMILQCS